MNSADRCWKCRSFSRDMGRIEPGVYWGRCRRTGRETRGGDAPCRRFERRPDKG